jgi:hypothetical protein
MSIGFSRRKDGKQKRATQRSRGRIWKMEAEAVGVRENDDMTTSAKGPVFDRNDAAYRDGCLARTMQSQVDHSSQSLGSKLAVGQRRRAGTLLLFQRPPTTTLATGGPERASSVQVKTDAERGVACGAQTGKRDKVPGCAVIPSRTALVWWEWARQRTPLLPLYRKSCDRKIRNYPASLLSCSTAAALEFRVCVTGGPPCASVCVRGL